MKKYLTQIKNMLFNMGKSLVHNSKACKNMVCSSKAYKNIKAHFNINTMSLIIAVLASYISYQSLNESIKQRESMYKPVLFLGSEVYYVDIQDMNNLRYYHFEPDSSLKEVSLRPYYTLYNVGKGSALSIHGTLTFNTKTMMNYFTKNGLTEVKVIENFGPMEDIIIFKDDSISIFSSNVNYVQDWTADYELPISDSKERSIQYFPPLVLDNIVKSFLWVSSVNSNNDICSFFVPIKLEYLDINEKKYEKCFNLSINCFDVSKNIVGCKIKAYSPHDPAVIINW